MGSQPRSMPRVIPMLSYEDVAQAAEWLAEAFGLLETGRWADTDGRVTHVNMELGDGMVMLGSPSPQYQSPRHHTEVCDLARAWSTTPVHRRRGVRLRRRHRCTLEPAQAGGATILSPLEDNLAIGQRSYRAEDVEGHRWMFAQPV
jgi:uncharacterized glyoxalase superfamily protein PhnB